MYQVDRDAFPQFSKQERNNWLSCPFCYTNYNPYLAEIIEESEAAHLFHLQCQKCGTQVLALVVVDFLQTIRTLGLVTDLSSHEVIKFKNSSLVEMNDVIDLHFFWQAKDVQWTDFLLPQKP